MTGEQPPQAGLYWAPHLRHRGTDLIETRQTQAERDEMKAELIKLMREYCEGLRDGYYRVPQEG